MDPHVQYQQSLPLDTLLVGTPDPADLVSISQVPYTLLIFYLTGFSLSLFSHRLWFMLLLDKSSSP